MKTSKTQENAGALRTEEMMGAEIKKSDWKLFQERVPDWQEAYMEKLEEGYVKLLTGKGNPSEKFWIRKEIRNCEGTFGHGQSKKGIGRKTGYRSA